MFQTSIYQNRRGILSKNIQDGILVFPANRELGMNFADNVYHFRQDSTFLYYFGIDQPDIVGVLDTDTGEEIIFGDELSIDAIIWMGALETLASKCEKAGIKDVRPKKELAPFLEKAKRNQAIHYLPPYRHDIQIDLSLWLDLPINLVNKKASIPFIKAVVAQRSIKEEVELVELRKAVDITNQMHLKAMEMAQPGVEEAEIAAELQRIAQASGGQLSFPSIVTKNGEILHNHYHGNTLKEGDLLLVDAGAETAMHYAGDMSRTMPVGGKFSQRQKEIFEVVYGAHQTAIEGLRPGERFLDRHLAAAAALTDGLKDLGLMKGDTQEAVAAGAHTLFFQCGLGHMMGLDVHDMENLGEEYVGYTDTLQKSKEFGLKSLRLGKELEKGYVITIEPGIYFIPQLIDQWKANKHLEQFINYDVVETYKDFGGIRQEEDFVITDNGYELLGEEIAKTVEAVEKEVSR
ncbi:aminopeptidase P family protein [Algivirga pacifica]|uniref:Xaa-Pro aminopeptidase n=1 Tax=Algivirga pacifica TaxID=1162670 RepID=A0ABP9D8A7_9BACT